MNWSASASCSSQAPHTWTLIQVVNKPCGREECTPRDSCRCFCVHTWNSALKAFWSKRKLSLFLFMSRNFSGLCCHCSTVQWVKHPLESSLHACARACHSWTLPPPIITVILSNLEPISRACVSWCGEKVAVWWIIVKIDGAKTLALRETNLEWIFLSGDRVFTFPSVENVVQARFHAPPLRLAVDCARHARPHSTWRRYLGKLSNLSFSWSFATCSLFSKWLTLIFQDYLRSRRTLFVAW